MKSCNVLTANQASISELTRLWLTNNKKRRFLGLFSQINLDFHTRHHITSGNLMTSIKDPQNSFSAQIFLWHR